MYAVDVLSDAIEALGGGEPELRASLLAMRWSVSWTSLDARQRLLARVDTPPPGRRGASNDGRAPAARSAGERGELVELEADAQSALAHALARAVVPLAAACLAEALVERGDADAAEAQLRGAGLDVGTPPSLVGVVALVARAHVRLAQQRPADALALFLECGRVEDAWGVVSPSMTNWRAEAAVLLDRLGEPERARPLAAEAVRRAGAFGSPVARGLALRAAALVERPPDPDGLTAAVELLRRGGARLELARSLVERGAALRRAGRRGDARAALREGVALAAAIGTHLKSAFGKLDIGSRSQLARALA